MRAPSTLTSVPALLPLAFLWVMAGDPQSIAVAALIVLFGLMQVFFVRDNERVVRESFVIRYENERLLEALERERQEVLLARDRAEEANRAKSQFLAAASHDLRQPLHALVAVQRDPDTARRGQHHGRDCKPYRQGARLAVDAGRLGARHLQARRRGGATRIAAREHERR